MWHIKMYRKSYSNKIVSRFEKYIGCQCRRAAVQFNHFFNSFFLWEFHYLDRLCRIYLRLYCSSIKTFPFISQWIRKRICKRNRIELGGYSFLFIFLFFRIVRWTKNVWLSEIRKKNWKLKSISNIENVRASSG